jgi:hypothetical protein
MLIITVICRCLVEIFLEVEFDDLWKYLHTWTGKPYNRGDHKENINPGEKG